MGRGTSLLVASGLDDGQRRTTATVDVPVGTLRQAASDQTDGHEWEKLRKQRLRITRLAKWRDGLFLVPVPQT